MQYATDRIVLIHPIVDEHMCCSSFGLLLYCCEHYCPCCNHTGGMYILVFNCIRILGMELLGKEMQIDLGRCSRKVSWDWDCLFGKILSTNSITLVIVGLSRFSISFCLVYYILVSEFPFI